MVTFGLRCGVSFAPANRAVKLMNRLGIFEQYQRTKEEIAELEERFAVPLEQILGNEGAHKLQAAGRCLAE